MRNENIVVLLVDQRGSKGAWGKWQSEGVDFEVPYKYWLSLQMSPNNPFSSSLEMHTSYFLFVQKRYHMLPTIQRIQQRIGLLW